jgi:hypothetical protein
MTPKRVALLTLIFACAIPSARAQHPDWDMNGAQEVNSSLKTLPAQDQHGIERALSKQPQNLRAMRVDTPSGHIFLVQGFGDYCSPTGN